MRKKAHIGTDIAFAAECLRGGGLVGIPTETVYGLAANGLDALAVARIFEAKRRPAFDPLILHVPDIASATALTPEFNATAQRLAKAFWPGPLTLVLPRKPIVPDLVTSGLPTVGIRVPAHPLTLELLRGLGFPLAAPSANPFGYVSPTTAQHVADQLGAEVDYILDGGPCAVGVESTIVDVSAEKPAVLRLGGISLEALQEVLGFAPGLRTQVSSNPTAPGQLDSHYSPLTRVVLGDIETELLRSNPEGTGILAFQKADWPLPQYRIRVLSPMGDLREAAQNLFRHLRELDSLGLNRILAEPVPDVGLGRAINDRLRRAAFRG